MKSIQLIKTLIFPLRCPVCDEIAVPFGEKICLSCMPRLEYITPPRCYKCGKKLRENEQEYCYDCSKGRHLYRQGRALYDYRSAAPGIYRFKYGGRQEYGDFYGEEIARYFEEFIRFVKPDGLLPVPLHPKRLKKRGYNQSALLAKAVGKYTGLVVYDNFILRCRNTTPLKQLNPVERQNNLKNAFNIAGNDVKLKTVIVIDDIYTTGSTINEMSVVLREHGVEEVYFIALACGTGI